MHVVRVKQVNLYDIRAKQASRYNVVFRLHGDHADCILSPMQSADCGGSQIACNIHNIEFFKCVFLYYACMRVRVCMPILDV